MVVIGAGGVGLSVDHGAALAGASPIIAVDTQPAKLELARQAGATHAVVPATSTRLHELTDGEPTMSFECDRPRRQTVELAVDLVRPGGSVTLVGMTPQGERAGIDVYRFVEDGKMIRGSNYGSAMPASRLSAHRRSSTPPAACRSTC